MATQLIPATSFFETAHLARIAQEVAPRSYLSIAKEAMVCAIDTGSTIRNSTIAASIIGSADVAAKTAGAITGMVMTGGIMAFLYGIGITHTGAQMMKTSYDHGDWEGAACNTVFLSMGLTYVLAGAGMTAAESATIAGSASVAAAATTAFLGGATALYAGVALYGAVGLGISGSFRTQLNSLEKENTPQNIQLATQLEWLRGKVTDGKTEKELHKKWDQFARRTSEASGRYVRENVTPDFIAKVRKGDAEAIDQATFILQEVKRDNSKQMVKSSTFLIVGLIGIAACIFAILVASGPFSPILFAVAALVWFLIDSNKIQAAFGNLCCGKSQLPPAIEMAPPPKKSPLMPSFAVKA